MDERTAKRRIRKVDMARSNYQKKYCPEVRTAFDHKDFMMDSSKCGIDKTAGLLSRRIRGLWEE